MPRLSVIILSILITLMAILTKFIYVDDAFDIFVKLEYHTPCKRIAILEENGIEDFAFDPETSTAFLSIHNKRREAFNSPVSGTSLNGKIGLFDFRQPEKIETLNIIGMNNNYEFRPHGIGLYRHSNKTVYLFVINHREDCDAVEKLEFKNGKLYYIETFTSPFFSSINDVAPVNTRSFYVTIDFWLTKNWKFIRILEKLFPIPLSSLVYYDKNSQSEAVVRTVEHGLFYANGVNVKGDYLYLADTGKKTIFVYKRTEFYGIGSLEKVNKIFLKSGVDNIEFDKDGNIFVGSHPKAIDFLRHAIDPKNKSPSQVFKIYKTQDKNNNMEYKVEEIYLSNNVSGSSVAMVHNDILIIGTVFDPFLVCYLK